MAEMLILPSFWQNKFLAKDLILQPRLCLYNGFLDIALYAARLIKKQQNRALHGD
jgi:hypothetical protein